MKKIKPILFSTEMVQAILDGRKTQTRIVINPQPIVGDYVYDGYDSESQKHYLEKVEKGEFTEKYVSIGKSAYQKGDILWVKETLYQNGESNLEYIADREWIDEDIIPKDFNVRVDKNGVYKFCKIPSIYMPKFAARIFLEVTDVRAERLQDISEKDAVAEGITEYAYGYWKNYLTNFAGGRPKTDEDYKDPRLSFQSLWQKINDKKHPWESNLWVWVYTFKRIEKPENF